jgi:hypothetical protein
MKELPLQQQGQLPITLKIRILKFWNPTVYSVHSAPIPLQNNLQRGRVGAVLRTGLRFVGALLFLHPLSLH